MSAAAFRASLALLANVALVALVLELAEVAPLLGALVALAATSAGTAVAGVQLADALYVAPARHLPPPEQCSTGCYSGPWGDPPERCAYPALHGHPEECAP